MNKYITTKVDKAVKFFDKFDFTKVSFDVETLDTKWYHRWCHGGSYEEGCPTGISLCNGQQAIYIDTCGWSDDDMHKLIETFRENWVYKGQEIIAHNLPFDVGCLRKYGIKFKEDTVLSCSMTAAHLLDENRPKSLKYLASNILGQEEVVPWVEARFDKKVFQKYALNDAVWTWELMWRFKQELEHQNLSKLFYEIECPFQKCLIEMEENGVLIDMDRVHKTADELEQALVEKEIEMLEFLGEPYEILENHTGPTVTNQPINFNSSQQLGEVLFDRLGLEVIETTRTGKRSTGKSTLVAHKGHPFIKILKQYKIIQKLLSAFFVPLPEMVDLDGKVRPNFRNTGTVTGRLSCASPNLQQLPKKTKEFPVETRDCFIAPKGYKMIACDFAQQETRVMADLSGDQNLIKLIREGGDIHLFSANNVFGLGIPEEKLFDNHPEHHQIKEQYKAERNKGKVFSFGIPYGMTEHKAAKDFGVSTDEGKRLMDNFFKGFPDLEHAINVTHKEAERNLYVKTYTGRRRRFQKNQWGKLSNRDLRQSFNFLIQSLGADLVRLAHIKLYEYARKHPYMGIKQIMSVHDEVVFLVKEEYAQHIATDIERMFESVWELCVPLKAEASIGSTYGEVK